MDRAASPHDVSSGQAPYSTLEVDDQANTREKGVHAQDPSFPTIAVEESFNILPQVGANPEDYPEAVHREHEAQQAHRTNPKLCELPKRAFWILLAILTLIVIAAAVGGGVGGTLANKSSSPSSDSSLTGTAFLPNTYLAAVNYTKGDVDHHLVFFQTTDDGIYQSAWNSSGKMWQVSPVNAKDSSLSRAGLFKTPTPISASFYACSSDAPNLTLYFLDSSSRLRQLQTSNPDDSVWSFGSFDSDYNVPAASHLASYGCGHPSYPDYTDAWFQDTNGDYQLIDSSGTKVRVSNALTTNGITMVNPPPNSSLTLVPHYIYDYNNTRGNMPPYLSLFYVSSGVLYEYHYNNSKFDFIRPFDRQSEPRLPQNTHIAGFSWGYNDTKASINGMQVLYTMPENGAGGISILRLNKYRSENWDSTDATSEDNPFKEVASYSSVAATQAERVYAAVESGGKVELREWEYVRDEDTYKLVGTVNTDVRK